MWAYYLSVISILAVVTCFVAIESARWMVPLGGALALFALGRAVGRGRPLDLRLVRDPLVLLAIGLALTVGGEVLAALGGSMNSWVDPVALSAYPFLIAALVALNGSRVHEQALDTVLVAAIVPSALVAFGWLPMVEAVERWAGSTGDTSWTAWLMLAVDALAVAIIARLAMLFRGRPIAYQMLLAAMACMLGAHIARAVGAAIGLAPAPFGAQSLLLVSFALMSGAVLHPSMRPASATKTRADAIGRQHLLLLILAVLVGPVFAVLRYGDRGSWVLLVVAGPAAVSLLVVAHLARLIHERQRLEYLATHDSLTGLPNRTAFHDRLTLLLGRATAAEGPGVMFLDLDRFKYVNDSYGHDIGDELLCEVSERLRDCVRADDTVARLAGDEFAVLLAAPHTAARADDVAQRILSSFTEPFYLTGAALSVSASLGIALAPEHGADVETLLRNADSAMYAAKAGGRNTTRTFSAGLASATERHLLLEQRFRRAISDGELILHYQPRVDTLTGQVVAVEALVRWHHPRLGIIGPGAFIQTAESTGSIADLGSWVLEQACTDAAAWHHAGFPLTVSVNVSPRQFALQDVPAIVGGVLARTGLPARSLELELTESLHLSDDGSVTDALRRIHALGVVCAVDDFGTGYSSIAVLRDYPIGVVKLDRSFVQSVGCAVDAPLVRGVVQLARGLGMRVVAEGVETRAQRDFLADISCDEIQGFLISRAVPAPHILTMMGTRGGALPLVPCLGLVVLEVDERRLVELLWAEQEEFEKAQDPEPRQLRLASVLGAAVTVMTVPFVLGMGAGGGLPPLLLAGLTSTLDAIGAEPPRPEFEGATTTAIPGPRRSSSKPAEVGNAPVRGELDRTPRGVTTSRPTDTGFAGTVRPTPPVGDPSGGGPGTGRDAGTGRDRDKEAKEDKAKDKDKSTHPSKGSGRPTTKPDAGKPTNPPGKPTTSPGNGSGKPTTPPSIGPGTPATPPGHGSGKPATPPGKPATPPATGKAATAPGHGGK